MYNSIIVYITYTWKYTYKNI